MLSAIAANGFTVAYAYDYVLTLPDEITYIWTQKPSLTTVMYLVNRYIVFAILTEEIYVTFAGGGLHLVLDIIPGPDPWVGAIPPGIWYFIPSRRTVNQ